MRRDSPSIINRRHCLKILKPNKPQWHAVIRSPITFLISRKFASSGHYVNSFIASLAVDMSFAYQLFPLAR